MHFERQNVFQNTYYIFFRKKNNLKKICVPTLPKIFRPVTRNTLIFFIWPNQKNKYNYVKQSV